MRKKRIIWSIIFLLVAAVVFTGTEFAVNMQIKPIPDLPEQSLSTGGLDELVYALTQENDSGLLEEDSVNEALAPVLQYINARYDCSDFRVSALIRMYLSYEDRLPNSTKKNIEDTLLGFKYWMDQTGDGRGDSMCYWSENHQILFAVSEYLAGTRWPDRVFTADGKTGSQHADMAKSRIESWMEQRFLYGFTEFYSNNYYPEDIAAMSNLLQFSKDGVLVNRMKMIMDIIWFDLASQSHKYVSAEGRAYYIFLSASGRMYEDNEASDDLGNRLRKYIDFIVQPDSTDDWQDTRNSFFNSFRLMVNAGYYQVPEVIKAIFDDDTPRVIKSSQSLDVSELKRENLLGLDDDQIMMQLNMEAFTNSEVIGNTLRYMTKNRMFQNGFLNDFKMVNLSLLKWTGLIGPVSKLLNPATNGVAIQRANVYTYKTKDYAMSTAQDYHPGDYGDQQHIFTANLSNDLSVFITQPARVPERGSTPNYWVGNGRNPYAMQEKNVNISIFDVPQSPGLMEPHVVKYTHAYFPVQYFDETDESRLADGYVFGRKGDTYIALIGSGPLLFADFDPSDAKQAANAAKINGDLVQRYDLTLKEGRYQSWITEVSCASDEGSFAVFKQRILGNPVSFQGTTVDYKTNNAALRSEYRKQFTVDSVAAAAEYGRYENAYVPGGVLLRKPSVIEYRFRENGLLLDYAQNIRRAE